MTVISLFSQIVWDYLHKLSSNFVASFKETNVLLSRLPQAKRKKHQYKEIVLFFCWHPSCLENASIL